MKISREQKTAILILSCIAIFIFGFNYLKGTSLLDNSKIVSAHYSDVEGLVVGANVTINGMNVGKVKNIDFDSNYEKINVTFSLRNDLMFTSGFLFIIASLVPILPSGSFFTSYGATIFFINYSFLIRPNVSNKLKNQSE